MKTHCPNCDCEINFPEIVDESISCPSCGSRILVADDETQTLTVELRHQRLGDRFDLISKLGKGQFGEVYKAKDLLLDRWVAIKVPFRKSLSYSQLSMIQYEAQAAAQLEHPNIVRIYEILRASSPVSGPSGDSTTAKKSKAERTIADTQTDLDSERKLEAAPGSLCIVSQWIDGLSLKECLGRFKGNHHAIAKLCSTLARAIDHAHKNGIIHRDLKPANIMINREDNPFITDFGLARRDRLSADSSDDSTILMVVGIRGEILGTPAYMSPQQAQGLSHLVDGRTDVYSLGIILYELLTGKRPFEGGSRALLYRVLHEDIPDPRKLDKQIPHDLASICQKAAEKSPDKRYANAAEMAEDLERYLRREPIKANPWPWPRRARRWLRVNRAPIAITVSLLLLVGIVLQAAMPNTPDWWKNAITIRIETEDQSPDATFFFERLDESSWLPDPVEPFTLGPLSHPVNTKIPPGLYRVYAWTPDGRYHQVLRTIPKSLQDLSGTANYKAFRFDRDVAYLPPIKLFSPNERISFQKISGGNFKTSLHPYHVEHTYRVPDLMVGMHEVTWGDIRRNNVPLPSVMARYTKPGGDDEPVTGFLADWAIQLAEDLGGEICNELVWRYSDEKAATLTTGPQGFRNLISEATVTHQSNTLILGYESTQCTRRLSPISEKESNLGFRLYIRVRPPNQSTDLMMQKQ